jgi:diaminohydroxyphosphoribosylaminopyrimidine deaminase/5-amino-6-(5-phosphoribosylamino)uracil reductase
MTRTPGYLAPDMRHFEKRASRSPKASLQIRFATNWQGYLSRHLNNRPQVILKLAVSADGKIAAERGKPTRITGPEVKARVHLMRSRADAIMVGVSTVLADDPELTCRLPGLFHLSPVRVVSDSKLSIPLQSHLVRSAREVPVWVMTTNRGFAASA